MLARNLIDPAIPEIRLQAANVLSATYSTIPVALDGIATLKSFYQTTYPDYYSANAAKIDTAITTLQFARHLMDCRCWVTSFPIPAMKPRCELNTTACAMRWAIARSKVWSICHSWITPR